MNKQIPYYQSYRLLSHKQKHQRIIQAKHQESNGKLNPQKNYKFAQENFMDFSVLQQQKIIKLHTYRNYKSKDFSDAVAVLIMFHGLNSHLGHGAHIADFFSHLNIITVGFDHRGFGKSQGLPGYIESIDIHLKDSKEFVDKIKNLYPNLPLYLLGLSMGGLTSYHLSLKQPKLFSGAILMAPAFRSQLKGFKYSVMKGLLYILPRKSQFIRGQRGVSIKNLNTVNQLYNDGLTYCRRSRVGTLKTLFKQMNSISLTFQKYQTPVVYIQGGLDKLIDPQVSLQFYDKCRSQDKQLWFYENMWHDVWHQQQIQDILNKLKSWFIKRLTKIL